MGKSGSPAPNPMTGRPAAFRAFALASTARVADSAIAAIRAEIRGFVTGGSLPYAWISGDLCELDLRGGPNLDFPVLALD